ncbi:MAG: hypothetical protein ACI4RU_05930 [Acutalibacteraceae bacterium]
MEKLLKFNYDYSRCMVMKLGMARPEKSMNISFPVSFFVDFQGGFV